MKLFKLSCYADALSTPKHNGITIFITKIELCLLNNDEEIDESWISISGKFNEFLG